MHTSELRRENGELEKQLARMKYVVAKKKEITLKSDKES